MIHPQIDIMVVSILGRILSHGYLVCGHFPKRIPTLAAMILGLGVTINFDAFLDYITETERLTFRDALKCKEISKFLLELHISLLDVLSRFGCRTISTPVTLLSAIESISD